jgi:sulfonate transport system permease protein
LTTLAEGVELNDLAGTRDFEVVVGSRLGLVAGHGLDPNATTPGANRSASSGVWRPVLRSRWTHIGGPLLLLIAWQLAVTVGHVPANKIPSPDAVINALRTLISSGQLGTALAISVRRVALGLLLGVAIGSGLALSSGLTRLGERLIDPVVHMFRTMPVLALLPMFVLWFGIGEKAKVFLIAWAVTFPIYINLFAGIKSTDPKLIEAGRVLGLSRLGQIRDVILPSAMPQFLTGLRLAMGVSWLVLVAAEEINAVSGLGFLITTAESLEQTNIIFAVLLVFSLLGVASDVIVRLIERWALAWRSSYVNR